MRGRRYSKHPVRRTGQQWGAYPDVHPRGCTLGEFGKLAARLDSRIWGVAYSEPELSAKHRLILSLYVRGFDPLPGDPSSLMKRIALRVRMQPSGVNSVIDRTCRRFFPEIADLKREDYKLALLRVGRAYLDDFETRSRTAAELNTDAQLLLKMSPTRYPIPLQIRTALTTATAMGTTVKSEYQLAEVAMWVKGRVAGLQLNHTRAAVYLHPLERKDCRDEVRAIMHNDLANNCTLLGDLARTCRIARSARLYFQSRLARAGPNDRLTKDRLLLGEARALIEEQAALCFREGRDACHAVHREVKSILDSMSWSDNYGWSKTYQMTSLCSYFEGDAEGSVSLKAEAAEHVQLSLRFADQIQTPTDAWIGFRDGWSVGKSWRQLLAASAGADIHLALDQRLDARQYHRLGLAARGSLLMRWLAPHIPPLRPFSSWQFDIEDGRDLMDIDRELHDRNKQLEGKGLHVYLPQARISYGDFLREARKRRFDLSDPDVQYESARLLAKDRFRVLERLANSRLS